MDRIGRSPDTFIPTPRAPRAAASETSAGPVDTVTTGQTQKTEAELKGKIQRIEMLGKTFGGGQLTFQQGDAWSTAQSSDGAQLITYRAEDLVGHSSDYAVGKVLSEASKAKYSRWVVPSELAQDESFLLLQNSVDTARTGNLIGARFPGAREFIAESVGQDLASLRQNYTEILADKLVAKSKGQMTREQALQTAQAMGGEIPKSIQFSNGVIQEWQQQTKIELDPEVKKALDGVRSDLRQAYQPPRDTLREDLSELEIREQATRSHELVKEKVWPAYQGLLQADIDKLAEELSQPDENSQPDPNGESDPNGKADDKKTDENQKPGENKKTDDKESEQNKPSEDQGKADDKKSDSDDQKKSEAGGKPGSGGKPQAGGKPGASGEPSASDSAEEPQPPLDPAEQKALEEELAKNPQALEEAMKSMKPSPGSPSAGQASPALQKAMQQALQNNPQLQKQLQDQMLKNPELQKAAQEQLPDNQSLQQNDPKQLDQAAKDAMNQALQKNPELAQEALDKAKQDPAVKKAAAEALRQNPEFQKAVAEQMGKPDSAQGVEQALEELAKNPQLAQAMEKAAQQQSGLDQAMADQIAEAGQQQSLQDALKQNPAALKEALNKAAQSTSAQDAGVQQSVQQALAQNSALKQQAQQQMLNNPDLVKSALEKAPGNASLQQAAASKDGRKLDAQAKEALKEALQDKPEVAQQIADKLKNDPSVQQAAAKALAKNPEFQQTLAREMGQDPKSGRMGKALQELQKEGHLNQAIQALPGLAEALAQAAVGSGDPAGEGKMDPKEAKELARQVMEEFAKEMNEKLETQQKDVRRKERSEVKMQDSPQPAGPQRASQDGSISQTELQKLESLMEQKSELDAALESMRSEYDKIHGTVAPMADELAGELKNFLHETSRPHYQRPLRDSGKKIDMRAAMAAQAKLERTGTYDSEIWLRRNNPTQRSQKFILLVDESGSMGGEKWVAALRAMVMSMEALDSLDIDFGVIGFSDKPRIHKGLNENFDLDSRDRIVGSLAQPMSGSTNDDQGIQTSIDMLLEQGDPEDEKIIIVITDGIGNKEAVKRLQEEYKDKFIHMIGVGIGPGMADVKDVYEDHAAVASLQDLPYELAEIVRRKIQGDD